MRRVLRLLRSTVVLMWLCGALVVSTVALGLQAITLSAQVATVTAGAASVAAKHRKDLAKAVSKAKAKARLRRFIVAIPFVGGGAALAFEAQDFQDWQAENPEGSFAEYSCEVAEVSAELVDDVLQDLPEVMRPSRDAVLAQLPDCDAPT